MFLYLSLPFSLKINKHVKNTALGKFKTWVSLEDLVVSKVMTPTSWYSSPCVIPSPGCELDLMTSFCF